MSGTSFRDHEGGVLWLSPATEVHIRDKHRLTDTKRFITETLAQPIAILRSKWEPDTRIYFKPAGRYYQAVIVAWTARRIKTAHLMRHIEGVDRLWSAPDTTA